MNEETKSELRKEANFMLKRASLDFYQSIRDNYLIDLHGNYDSLREEIFCCITLQLFQASITLTNHLLELLLKDALIINHCNTSKLSSLAADEKMYAEAVNLFNDLKLNDTINRARTAGFITREEKKQLIIYQDKFRNAYSHADKKKIFGDEKITLAYGTLDGSKPTEVASVSLQSMLPLHGMAKQALASKDAVPYFKFVDRILVRLEKSWHPEIETMSDLYKRSFS